MSMAWGASAGTSNSPAGTTAAYGGGTLMRSQCFQIAAGKRNYMCSSFVQHASFFCQLSSGETP